MRPRNLCIAPLALGLALLLAGTARAEEPTEVVQDIASVASDVSARPPGLFGPLNAPPVHLELSVDHTFHTPLKSYEGSFTVTRDRVILGTWAPLPGTFFFGLDVDIEGSDYDGKWGLVFGNNNHNNQTLYQISLGPKVIDKVTDKVSLYVGTVFFFAGAIDAEVKDSLRYELDLATQIKVTPKLTLTFGGGVRTGIEARPSFYPIAAFEYGRLNLALEGGTLKTSWPLIEYAEGAHELDFLASFGVDLRQFRLEEYSERHLTTVPGGVLRDTRFPLTVGLRYKPIVGIRISLTGGANFWQKLEVDDHLGRPLGRSHGRPAPFIGFRIEIDI